MKVWSVMVPKNSSTPPVWGKLVGLILGFLWNRTEGAIIGFILGHLYDLRPASDQGFFWRRPAQKRNHDRFSGRENQIYTNGIVALSAKLAKIDGRVNRAEINAFKRAFRITDAAVDEIGALFDDARKNPSGFEFYAQSLATHFGDRNGLLEGILQNLFMIAGADGNMINREEELYLRRVSDLFGFSQEKFTMLAMMAGIGFHTQGENRNYTSQKSSIDSEAYATLGIQANADEASIKQAYRALIRKNHPDKLASTGASASAMTAANEKMKRINAAYSHIEKIRGMK